MLAGTADPQRTLERWKEIFDTAVTGLTPLPGRDSRAIELDEFCWPWGPRALGELYRRDSPTDLDNLIDALVSDYDVQRADPVLEAMVGIAVRQRLLTAAEAGAVTMVVPEGVGIDDAQHRSTTALGEPVLGRLPDPRHPGPAHVPWPLRRPGEPAG